MIMHPHGKSQRLLDKTKAEWKNKGMLKSKNVFLFGSIGLVILAIGFVAVLDRTRQPGSPADLRARAGATNTLKVTAVVTSVDETTGTIVVTNVQFQDKGTGANKNLGEWKVTPPPGFFATSLQPGMNLLITIDARTFLATNHTVTATEIRIQK